MSSHERSSCGRVVAAIVGVALAASALYVAAPANASFPGTNGLIAYTTGGNVFVVNPANPVPVQITNTGGFGTLDFNAAANKIVASSTTNLVLLDPVAASAVTLVPNTFFANNFPAFNPAGNKIAFHDSGMIVTIDVAGTNRQNIFSPGTQPEWSADGTFIAFADPAGTRIRRITPTGGVVSTLATKGPANVACGGCGEPTVSPDSQKVAFTEVGAGNGLAQVNADGSTVLPTRLTTGAADRLPSYAPDGTKLVFIRGGSIGALTTVPSDGSTTTTTLGTITSASVPSWGAAPATGATFMISNVGPADRKGSCVFTVTRSGVTTGADTVAFAVTDPKTQLKSVSPTSPLSFAAGETTKTITATMRHRKGTTATAVLSSPSAGTSITTPSAACISKRKHHH